MGSEDGDVILDSSAIVAIALDEPERASFVEKINAAASVAVGSLTLVEAGIVLSTRAGEDAAGILAELVTAADAIAIEFGPAHWREALSAWSRFGRGRHAAGLNFGDCLAYAVAKVAGEPPLAKGDDFPTTDLTLA
jgi:ribonuclease VapC